MLAGLMAGDLRANAIIQYQVTDLGGTLHRYNYTLSGFDLLANDEIVIEFDPALYGALSNGQAPAGFDLMLFQPNHPVGAWGEYSALAMANSPLTTGTFSVDFVYSGSGPPGAQQFLVYDDNPGSNAILISGDSGPLVSSPEPSSLWLCGIGAIMTGLGLSSRRRTRRKVIKAA
jgi:hypothetical protein